MAETDYMNGWRDRKDVVIPPVEYKGFKENVVIRKRIEPFAAAVREEEDATTILEKPLKWRAYIRRVSTADETEIVKSPFVIGKSAECDYVVKDNTSVSRRHARIVTTREGYILEDLDSSNHTFIENIQINGPEKLKDRMQFQLSNEDFQFLLEIG